MAAERVVIRHKATGNTSRVTLTAYERAWSHNGWERIDADDVRKDELIELARDAGVDHDGTKTDILERLEQES